MQKKKKHFVCPHFNFFQGGYLRLETRAYTGLNACGYATLDREKRLVVATGNHSCKTQALTPPLTGSSSFSGLEEFAQSDDVSRKCRNRACNHRLCLWELKFLKED